MVENISKSFASNGTKWDKIVVLSIIYDTRLS